MSIQGDINRIWATAGSGLAIAKHLQEPEKQRQYEEEQKKLEGERLDRAASVASKDLIKSNAEYNKQVMGATNTLAKELDVIQKDPINRIIGTEHGEDQDAINTFLDSITQAEAGSEEVLRGLSNVSEDYLKAYIKTGNEDYLTKRNVYKDIGKIQQDKMKGDIKTGENLMNRQLEKNLASLSYAKELMEKRNITTEVELRRALLEETKGLGPRQMRAWENKHYAERNKYLKGGNK